MLAGASAVALTPAQAEHIRQGRTIAASGVTGRDGDLARAYDPRGRFCAVLVRNGAMWQPHKVFG